MGQRTLALPMALLFAALIAYASLYPFDSWRLPGSSPWAFVLAPWPRYWSWFDVVSNLLGYVPLGFLCVLSAVRARLPRSGHLLALVFPAALSLLMETVQVFLVARVPSNVDWLLNSLGGLLGGGVAWWLSLTGLLARWQRLKGSWFEPDAHSALILLALWPVALLYPTPLPFGVGQVGWMLHAVLIRAVEGTAIAHWFSVLEGEFQPLSLAAQALCMFLLLLSPCLLGFSVLRGRARRAVLSGVVGAGSVVVVALSAALTYGPAHAWEWLSAPAYLALGLLGLGVWFGAKLSRRACVVWLVWVLVVGLAILNRSPATPYFAESLQEWSQGRFIRFHGLTQWVGWAWPYAVMVHAAWHVSGRKARHLDTQVRR